MDIPDEFKCCATGNIMDDPVTCDDGYTYREFMSYDFIKNF